MGKSESVRGPDPRVKERSLLSLGFVLVGLATLQIVKGARTTTALLADGWLEVFLDMLFSPNFTKPYFTLSKPCYSYAPRGLYLILGGVQTPKGITISSPLLLLRIELT